MLTLGYDITKHLKHFHLICQGSLEMNPADKLLVLGDVIYQMFPGTPVANVTFRRCLQIIMMKCLRLYLSRVHITWPY